MKYTAARDAFESFFILAALNAHRWEKAATARALGLSRQGLFKLEKKYGLKPGMMPPPPSTFLGSDKPARKLIRRVVLIDADDLEWLRSQPENYSQSIRAGIKLLRQARERV